MAAGLGFKDFVTGEVLTAADVDGYLMQGVWVFASAAARDAAVTAPQEGNFAYLKDTNVTTYYTGSAWANLDTTGMTNPMTTTGDTIYSSSGSTPARLGIGTAGQVLQVNSGATAPEWATPAGGGGMTLISTTTLSGGTTSVTGIPGTYNSLMFVIRGLTASAANEPRFKINGSTANHEFSGVPYNGSAMETTNGNGFQLSFGNNIDGSGGSNAWTVKIDNYTSASTFKPFMYYGAFYSVTTSNEEKIFAGGGYSLTTAVTSIDIVASSGSFTGGTILTYGVK
jgi:hypothetical protein